MDGHGSVGECWARDCGVLVAYLQLSGNEVLDHQEFATLIKDPQAIGGVSGKAVHDSALWQMLLSTISLG